VGEGRRRVEIASFGEVERYDRLRVEGKCEDVVVGLGAVPGEEVLVGVYRPTEGTLVMPAFLQSVYHVRLFVASVAEC
jgi:hypothetical protein